MERKRSPVFVMGCHGSGTNLLYDMLLSAGGFAVYRGYLPIHKTLIPRFGSPDKLSNRKKILETWLRSKGFRRSGLAAERLSTKVLQECRTGGDFIRIVMDEIAREQNVLRWAVYDPDTALNLPAIKAEIPQALFVQIVRDGRDIALSLRKMGGFRPFPWFRRSGGLLGTALYWEWMVRKARSHGRRIPADYCEVSYENLVTEPRATLRGLGEFLDHDLDYDTIYATALGRLQQTNSSFVGDAEAAHRNPVNRWRERLSRNEVAMLEAVIGGSLKEYGYDLTTSEEERRTNLWTRWPRYVYPKFLDTKLWLKVNTPLGKLTNLAALELGNAVRPGY